MRTTFLVGFLAIIWSAYGAIYEDPSQLPSWTYDYIVVGGGAAGAVVANRLSEEHSVLLLEAGGSHEVVELTQIPLLGPFLDVMYNNSIDWNYTTVPIPGLNGRSIPYGRGFVLGGTTTTNFMVYNRGPRDDFDDWGRTFFDPRLWWDNIFKNFAPKNERWVPPNDCHNTTGQYNSSVHFNTGEVDVTLPGYTWPLDKRVMALTEEFPDQFPYNLDVNSGYPLGISWNQGSAGNGIRSSSATSYLGPEYIGRRNLSVLLHARVTQIVNTDRIGGKPVFGAVKFALSRNSRIYQANATKEVILSAGAINSPQILMLSGIGNKTELSKLGIRTIVDLPYVGVRARDHSMLANVVKVNTNETFDQYIAPEVIGSEIAKWKKTRQGPLSYTIANHIGYFRLPKGDPAFKNHTDPTSGPTSPHYELLFVPGFLSLNLKKPENDTSKYNTIFTVVTSPWSFGTIKLGSTDPFDPPLINPNYFANDFDMQVMVRAVRAVQTIVKSKSWEGYFQDYFGGLSDGMTDEDIIKYARGNAAGLWHFSGSAAMTQTFAQYGVVDPDFRVKKAVGLRVVDASVFFRGIPSAHPMGPIYLIAEYASCVIRQQRVCAAPRYQVSDQVPLMG